MNDRDYRETRLLIYPTAPNNFTGLHCRFLRRFCAVRSQRFWSRPWVSRRIVRATSAASRLTGFALAWRPSGVVQCSAAAARRGARASPLSCQANTQAPDQGFGFPRRYRLTRGLDLQTVIREGKRIRTVHLDVRAIASPLAHSRIGVVVPRHQHSAVDRNRLKRRLRELVRLELLPKLSDRPSADIAIRARRESYTAEFAALRDDIRSVAAQLDTYRADQ
jgi:ribonuclease P protein component